MPALPSIRPSSPLLGEVFNGNKAAGLKATGGLESPKREKSPIKVVNTFLLQAQALEAQEKLERQRQLELEQQQLLQRLQEEQRQKQEQQRLEEQQRLRELQVQQQKEKELKEKQEQLRQQQQLQQQQLQQQLQLQQQQLQQQQQIPPPPSLGLSTTELSPTKVGRQLSAASSLPPQPLPSPSAATAASSSPKSLHDSDPSAAGLSRSSSQKGFFSHFRKRARKRMSTSEDLHLVSPSSETSPGTGTSSMPISPLPQLPPLGRNSVVMEDCFEDAQEELPSFEGMDFMKEVDMGLKQRQSQHITIAASPVKGMFGGASWGPQGSSGPPSSHKGGGSVPTVFPMKPPNRHVPSPYPDLPPKLTPLSIPKRGSSRTHASSSETSDTSSSSRARKPHSRMDTSTPGNNRSDDGIKIPGAYPLSASPETSTSSLSRRNSLPLSTLSMQLPGAYPREQQQSSSGRSSAASYRTAFEPDTFDIEEQKQREEQMMLRQSLMEATRAIRALEKHPFTDFAERHQGQGQGQKMQGVVMAERKDGVDSAVLCDSPAWPAPPNDRGGGMYFR